MNQPLTGKIAVVAGATRGAGRGIATALGEAGATVYCTGRSVPGSPGMKNRAETIQRFALGSWSRLGSSSSGVGILCTNRHFESPPVPRRCPR